MSIVTDKEILSGLRELGVAEGDALLVHSSLKSFGRVERGADTVIDALLQCVGSRGCVVVPTLTLGVSECPVVFDVRNSPSRSGLITETLRKRPDARRSHHPTSSAAAIGWGVEQMTRWHGLTPCGLTSPYGQVYLRNGKCLFLGAKWSTNTMFHVAEELAGLPYLRYAEFADALLIDERGQQHTVTFRRYNCYQSGVRRDLEAMGPIYEASGVVRHAVIGNCEAMLADAKDIIDISCHVLSTQLETIVSYDKA